MSETIINLHGIEETLKDPPAGAIYYLAKSNPRTTALAALARQHGVPVKDMTVLELNRIGGPDNRGAALVLPQGRQFREVSLEDFLGKLDSPDSLVVLLDGVTDPQNYGAILRSCDQFGVDLVVVTARRAAGDTSSVFASSSGAAAWVSHAVVPNLTRALEALKTAGFWIYGADMNGQPVYKSKLAGRTALVLGAEGKGLSRLVKETCDVVVSIPTQGKLDSLNVSVSAGILLYEARRQKSAAE